MNDVFSHEEQVHLYCPNPKYFTLTLGLQYAPIACALKKKQTRPMGLTWRYMEILRDMGIDLVLTLEPPNKFNHKGTTSPLSRLVTFASGHCFACSQHIGEEGHSTFNKNIESNVWYLKFL